MTRLEKELVIGVLDNLHSEIKAEFNKQDRRADKRLEQGKDVAGADGQCDGLEKALKCIEAKIQEIRGIRASNLDSNETYMVKNTPITDETLKFAQMMELLRAGKKVKVKNRCYTGLQIPHLKLKGTDGTEQSLELVCCESHNHETYTIDNPLNLESISVVAYGMTSRCDEIEYVYSNPQMNRLTAHLKNGKEVDYDFNILSVWSAFDGEWEEPREVTLQFFLVDTDQHRKFYAEEKRQYPASWRVDQIVDEIKRHELHYNGMDIYVSFSSEDKIGYPCYIVASERYYTHENVQQRVEESYK